MCGSAWYSIDATRAAEAIPIGSVFSNISFMPLSLYYSCAFGNGAISRRCPSSIRFRLCATRCSSSLSHRSAAFSCYNNGTRLSSTCCGMIATSIACRPRSYSWTVCDDEFVCGGACCVRPSAVSLFCCGPFVG